jgi:hypothetical protein
MFERTKSLLNNYPEGRIRTGGSTLMHMNKIMTCMVEEAEAALTKKKAPEKVTVTKKKG